MNSCHHSGLDSKRPLQNERDGGQAVGLGSVWILKPSDNTYSTASIRDDILCADIADVVDTVDDIRDILARGRDDDLFRLSTLNVHTGRFPRRHLPCGFHDVLGTGR